MRRAFRIQAKRGQPILIFVIICGRLRADCGCGVSARLLVKNPGFSIDIANPAQQPVRRTGRGEALRPAARRTAEGERMIGDIDREHTIAGRGEQITDALLDLTWSSAHR
jgi:hypothetical protein